MNWMASRFSGLVNINNHNRRILLIRQHDVFTSTEFLRISAIKSRNAALLTGFFIYHDTVSTLKVTADRTV
ncbi:hypothetical protein HMPREF3170_06155 [Corynebacterium sp. HMSC08D02]|nr:hypothetical protein HMPREF3170_06155 [Corynebacterium sp. HMSC08D02]